MRKNPTFNFTVMSYQRILCQDYLQIELSFQGSSNSRSGPPSKGRVAHLKANGVTQVTSYNKD